MELEAFPPLPREGRWVSLCRLPKAGVGGMGGGEWLPLFQMPSPRFWVSQRVAFPGDDWGPSSDLEESVNLIADLSCVLICERCSSESGAPRRLQEKYRIESGLWEPQVLPGGKWEHSSGSSRQLVTMFLNQLPQWGDGRWCQTLALKSSQPWAKGAGRVLVLHGGWLLLRSVNSCGHEERAPGHRWRC